MNDAADKLKLIDKTDFFKILESIGELESGDYDLYLSLKESMGPIGLDYNFTELL